MVLSKAVKVTPPLYSNSWGIHVFQPAEVQDSQLFQPSKSKLPPTSREANQQGIHFWGPHSSRTKWFGEFKGSADVLPTNIIDAFLQENYNLRISQISTQHLVSTQWDLSTKDREYQNAKKTLTTAWKLTSKAYNTPKRPMKQFGTSNHMASTKSYPLHAPNNLLSHRHLNEMVLI